MHLSESVFFDLRQRTAPATRLRCVGRVDRNNFRTSFFRFVREHLRNCAQPASSADFARRVRAMPLTLRASWATRP